MADAHLAALRASEAVEFAAWNAPFALERALRDGEGDALRVLLKGMTYSAMVAACGTHCSFRAALPAGAMRAAAVRDDYVFQRTQDARLLVQGQAPRAHWDATAAAEERGDGTGAFPRRLASNQQQQQQRQGDGDAPSFRRCYMCLRAFVDGGSLGAWRHADALHGNLCFSCGVLNHAAALDSADLSGWTVLVTGCRHTVGRAVTLRLLRSGARVVATTRFPAAALYSFAREPCFDTWRDRLVLHQLDFLDPTHVAALLDLVDTAEPRIDALVSNAFLTVEQTPRYYAVVREVEARMAVAQVADAVADADGRTTGAEGAAPKSMALALAAVCTGSACLARGGAPPTRIDVGAVDALALAAGAAAATAYLAEAGMELNAHGNLEEPAGRPTLWSKTLLDTPLASIVETTVVNQVVPTALIQRVLARATGGGDGAGSGGGRPCVVINVTSTEHLHRKGAHAVTGMHKAAMENLVERVTYERRAGVHCVSVDPGFVTGVRGVPTPLDADDGAARVLHPLVTIASGRALDPSVTVLKDYGPFKLRGCGHAHYLKAWSYGDDAGGARGPMAAAAAPRRKC